MSVKAGEESVQRMRKFVEKYCEKSGTVTHPDPEVTEAVILGLARHYETLGKPLCPCRFYPDIAPGSAPATTCRFTSTATAFCS